MHGSSLSATLEWKEQVYRMKATGGSLQMNKMLEWHLYGAGTLATGHPLYLQT